MVSEAEVREALRQVQDPDLHQDIERLGFVKDVRIRGGSVCFTLELTTPACPVKDVLKAQAEEVVSRLPGVSSVEVTMTARTRAHAAAGGIAALAGVRHVILVGAGKGGVGKSTTAVELAWAMKAAGAKVALLDADIYGPSLVTMTGARAPGEQEGELHVPPEVDGVAVVSMGMFVPSARPMLLRGPRVTALVRQLLSSFAWGERDYLIVDCPPGTGDVHLTLAQALPVTGAVLVTTPQEVSVADTRRAASMFRTLKVPLCGVVETMAGFECGSCGALHPIFGEGGGRALSEDLKVPLLGQIPIDPALVLARDGAILPRGGETGPSAQAFRAAAAELVRRVSVMTAARGEALSHFELEWQDVG